MANALVLTVPHQELSAPRVAQATPANETRPLYVYGDSVPFPYGFDFIDTLDQAIHLGVALMKAQHAIMKAAARAAEGERSRHDVRAALLGMADAVKRSVVTQADGAPEIVTRTAARVLAVSRAVVEAELGAVDADAQRKVLAASTTLDEARVAVARAVEAFTIAHDLPGTQVALRVVAREAGYVAEAAIITPYGLDASFALAIPEDHAWSSHCRVVDLGDAVEVHVPRDAGWFSKRVELRSLKLGKLCIRAISHEPGRSVLTLGKGPRGPAYDFRFDPRRDLRVFFVERNDDSSDTAGKGGDRTSRAPFELSGEDAARVRQLWGRVVESTRDLVTRRTALKRAVFERAPLGSQAPQALCARLMEALAPITLEIARRAGASGELVLRRDAGERRRDEVYVTKAELLERIATLPAPLRSVFDPLGLEGDARSPRAPLASLPAYVEIDEDDILE